MKDSRKIGSAAWDSNISYGALHGIEEWACLICIRQNGLHKVFVLNNK
jgi:hypothetical protein